MNIILPIGGLGERFKNENYTVPKPLVKIFGKEMIFYVLDCLKLEIDDNIFIISKRDMEKNGFSRLITEKYPKIQFIYLDKQTEGAVETVLIGVNQIIDKTKNKKCMLLDCDNFYSCDLLKTFRSQSENAIFCFRDKQSNPVFSYLLTNESGQILQIKEKQKISELANTGAYCFKDINILQSYCKYIVENNIRDRNEYYLSCLVQKMIDDGHIFYANEIDIDNYHCVGTPFQLKIYCDNNILNAPKHRFCFDLDGTLVTAPQIKNDYSTVLPIIKNIEYLRFLKRLGHTIIIYTARRMRTHAGNIGKIVADVGKITIDTLAKFEIPYDELFFGKPYADFYIDDLAIPANFDLEKELGFYKTNIQERVFNTLNTSKMEVITKSSHTSKLAGEIYYYKNIPNQVRDLFPVFIDSSVDSYTIQKIQGITFSYLFVNDSLSSGFFVKFLESLDRLHKLDYSLTDDINIYCNYSEKISERYNSKYDYSQFHNSANIYNKLIDYFKKYESEKMGKVSIIHGDPVFSNVILDKNNNIKLIDMRGMLGDRLTMLGDVFYDYGKIYQSLLGYDEILLDRNVATTNKETLINLFQKYILEKFGKDAMYKIEMIAYSLLFTLLPLHNNDKCKKYMELIKL
jgi:capsule biosynthesis phosphatase